MTTQPLRQLRLLAPAKINLHLRVGPLGADGYAGFHPLVSWMVTVGLFDTLIMTRTDRGGDALRFDCDDRSLPTDERNLVVRAARLLFERAPDTSVAIELQKKIPHAAGLGGGSSDAAATLLGLNALLELGLSDTELHRLATQLGSDVPFFLAGPSAVCTGRGEVTRRISAPKPRCAVLIFPELSLSTARVYEAFDAQRPIGKAGASAVELSKEEWEEEPDWQHWASLEADALLPVLVNDLEAPAFEISPELARLRKGTQASLGRVVRMSGSGSTLFTLFDDQSAASQAAQKIRTDLRIKAAAVPLAKDDKVKG